MPHCEPAKEPTPGWELTGRSSKQKENLRSQADCLKLLGCMSTMDNPTGWNAADDASLANRSVRAGCASGKVLWHSTTVVADTELGGTNADNGTVVGARDACA